MIRSSSASARWIVADQVPAPMLACKRSTSCFVWSGTATCSCSVFLIVDIACLIRSPRLARWQSSGHLPRLGHYVDNNSTPTIAPNPLEANAVLCWQAFCQRAKPFRPLLCATMPVIGDTPCSSVAGAPMGKRCRAPPVLLGAQRVQQTELQRVREWPEGGQSCLPLACCLCHILPWTIWSRGQIVYITTKVGKVRVSCVV